MPAGPDFEVVSTERLSIRAHEPLRSWYHLSPYVWKMNGGYGLLLRGVPRRDDEPSLKIAQIFYGSSHDGVTFEMRDAAVIAPDARLEDRDGCEDPTLVLDDAADYVYYTGWNQERKTATLLYARGSEPWSLRKAGIALSSTPERTNPKEATVVSADDGTRLLFYEFSHDNASRIGIARSSSLDGPWSPSPEPFAARPDAWDSWHLSTGPIVSYDGLPLMFYNGATRDARWRIGWVRFDSAYGSIVDRCEDPVVTGELAADGGTDIAFAASAIVSDGLVQLYYSVSDKLLLRATLAPASPRVGSLLR